MLGTTILCINVGPDYDALLVVLGPEGFLFSYEDDVDMGGVLENVAHALAAVVGLYGMIYLSLGWGSRKTELEPRLECDPDCLPLPRNDS